MEDLEDIFGKIFKRKDKEDKELMCAEEAEEETRKVNLQHIKNYIEDGVHCGELRCYVKKIFPANIKILEGYGYKVKEYTVNIKNTYSSEEGRYETRYEISWGKEINEEL